MSRRPGNPRRRVVTGVAVCALAGGCALGVAGASGDVSHAGWPRTVVVEFAGNRGGHLVGTDGADMLLGGPGDDTIRGGPGKDVLWGDRYPVPRNGGTQVDRMFAGAGDDWIYASHGRNVIFAGAGNDHVFAYFGRGVIDCGAGYDVLTLDRTTEKRYRYSGCEVVRIGYP
jgi:Ca2+-binding RTX toxin-like protein